MRKIFNSKMWFIALVLVISMTGCDTKHDKMAENTVLMILLGHPGPGSVCEGTGCVSLGAAADLKTAGGYAILAQSGISTVPSSAVIGNIGVSPALASSITGFSLSAPAPPITFTTSAQVTGNVYAADFTGGTTSADLTAAVLSMQAAYTDAAGRTHSTPDASYLNIGSPAGTLTGLTLVAGVYEWGSAVTIPTDLTLNGSATDVWIFKVAGTLNMAADKKIILSSGAQAKNIFWQVSGAVTIGARTQFTGIILGQTSIAFGNLASITGRLLSQTAVTLDMNAVIRP